MPFFGPRLDRPSAIGEEGRPRSTSLSIAAFVVVSLFVTASVLSGRLEDAASIGTVASLVVVGVTLLGRDRITPLVLGQLTFLPSSLGLLGLVVQSFYGTPNGVLIAGFAISLVAVAASWADVVERDHLQTVLRQTIMAYGSMLIGFVVFAFVGSVGWFGVRMFGAFVGGVEAGLSAIGFLLVCSLTLTAGRVALRVLPIVQLAPRSRRQTVVDRVARWKVVTTIGALVSFLASVLFALLWSTGVLTPVFATAPVVTNLLDGLSSPFVVGPIAAVGILWLVAIGLALGARTVTRRTDQSSARWIAAALSGGLFALILVPVVSRLIVTTPTLGLIVAIFALAGPIAIVLCWAVVLVAMELGVLPDRAGGPALAAAGLVLAAIGAGEARLPAPFVFACAAGALVVWDVSEFGLGVTAELGHLPDTRRLEVFHGVIGVGLAVAVVLVASVLDVARLAVAGSVGVTAAAVVAVVGVLALLVPIRG